MKRTLSILASILLGAVAVALGMGLYLKKANDDRERLATIARQAQDEVVRIKEEGRQAVDQANKKIAHADAEIAKAQTQLQKAEEERKLLANAEPLIAANPKTTKGWKDAINLPLGISLKYPAGTDIETNDAESLTLSLQNPGPALNTSDTRWLSITPYDERLEQELTMRASSSTPVSYSVRGRLLMGFRGSMPGQVGTITVLRVRAGGETTHLIWAKEPFTNPAKGSLRDIFSTIDFSR